MFFFRATENASRRYVQTMQQPHTASTYSSRAGGCDKMETLQRYRSAAVLLVKNPPWYVQKTIRPTFIKQRSCRESCRKAINPSRYHTCVCYLSSIRTPGLFYTAYCFYQILRSIYIRSIHIYIFSSPRHPTLLAHTVKIKTPSLHTAIFGKPY